MPLRDCSTKGGVSMRVQNEYGGARSLLLPCLPGIAIILGGLLFGLSVDHFTALAVGAFAGTLLGIGFPYPKNDDEKTFILVILLGGALLTAAITAFADFMVVAANAFAAGVSLFAATVLRRRYVTSTS